MFLHNLFKSVALFLVMLVSVVVGQTPQPTDLLTYPFRVQNGSTWYEGHETMNRNSEAGYLFTKPASYTWSDAQGPYSYIVFHPGWDMNVRGFGGDNDKGQSVFAIAGGRVLEPQTFDSGQNYYTPMFWNEIAIDHNVGGKSWITTYGHMQKIFVKVGDIVTAGQLIGEVGDVPDPENKMGAHMHLEVRDPSAHPNPTFTRYWDNSRNTNPETNQLHILSNVQSWYYNPELFIKGFPALGRTSTGNHSAMLQFVSTYLSFQGSKTGSYLWGCLSGLKLITFIRKTGRHIISAGLTTRSGSCGSWDWASRTVI